MSCREEILAAIAAILARDRQRPVSPAEVVEEMRRRGSDYPETTIRTHVVSHMCIDAPGGKSGAALRRVGRGQYMLLDQRDPQTLPAAVPARLRADPGGGGRPVGQEWPWEGRVQAVFVDLLVEHGWTVLSEADTATRAPGLDVTAAKGVREMAAEVKGWPGTGYSDPRRAHETKPTAPTTQAGHWFAQAVFKALMLRDSHPRHESLVVVPDYPRYRDLAQRTRTGRGGAGVHVVFVEPDGRVHSTTWTP
jgi:hypothetical protein